MYYVQCQASVIQEGIIAMPMDIIKVDTMHSRAIIETIKHHCASEATKMSMQQGTGVVKPQEIMIISVNYLGDREEEEQPNDRTDKG